MEAIVAIISAIIGLFLYNTVMRNKTLSNNDEVTKKDQELETVVKQTQIQIDEEKAKQEAIKAKLKQDTTNDVSTSDLTDFFNDRKP